MSCHKLRVLHVGKFYAPYRGGIETHLQLLCGELRKHTDLTVVVANSGRSTVDELVEGVRVRRVPTWANVASAPLCPRTVHEIRRSQADIVHLHLPNPAATLAYLASGHRKALICSYHSDTIRQKLLGPAFEPILLHALRRSSAVIAASPNYINSSPVLSTIKDRCHVIPYGVSLAAFDQVSQVEVKAIRERYGPNIVVAVGRLVYYKGFKFLIRAMEKVRGVLLLIGAGPLKSELWAEAQARGLSDRVVFLGEVDDVIPYYHAADLLVLPSVARSEAFGIVQLEAMACGKPVVNTDLDSGVTFASVDGSTGLTVPPENPNKLASAINLLLMDSDLRARYGTAARRRVQELFTVDTMMHAMLELYNDVYSRMQHNGSNPEGGAATSCELRTIRR